MNRFIEEDLLEISDLIAELGAIMKTLASDIKAEVQNILKFDR